MSSGVSVIIPTRDRGRLLVDAVRSASTAPEPPLEVIVADAGSSDGSVDALAEFGDAVRIVAAAGTLRPVATRARPPRGASTSASSTRTT